MDFIKKLLKLFEKPKGTGALPDPRQPEEKEKDYWFKEIVSAPEPVARREKKPEEWRKFPIFNQDGSGSCVAQTLAKLLGILYWLKNGDYIHFSATHIYQRRANKPQSGMWGVNAFEIAQQGVTLEELVPSQNMTDAEMDAVKIPQYKQDVGSVFKIGNYVLLPPRDIDTIASTIQKTGKGVMVWFYFKLDEWTNVPAIKYAGLPQSGTDIARHSVTAVDFTLYEGERALIIEDSWGSQYGIAGQRIIKESFYKTRNLFAAYPITFKFDEPTAPVTPKPQYTFAKTLAFGITDPDVKALQDILKYEGLFPINTESTGYYGAITAKGVLAWQKAHQVAPDAELEALAGKSVGAKTIAKLNELYS
jgi:hypothetical protein